MDRIWLGRRVDMVGNCCQERFKVIFQST